MNRVLRYLAALASTSIIALSAIACESKMEPQQCDKLRGDAFDLLNKAQKCDTDADCRGSEWPGCSKPVSNGTFDQIKPMKAEYTKGKCEEPKVECKEAPTVYCKQGLCVHREKGMPEAPAAPPPAGGEPPKP